MPEIIQTMSAAFTDPVNFKTPKNEMQRCNRVGATLMQIHSPVGLTKIPEPEIYHKVS